MIDLFLKNILMTAQRYLCLNNFITKEPIIPEEDSRVAMVTREIA
jgi:hypothetical protein